MEIVKIDAIGLACPLPMVKTIETLETLIHAIFLYDDKLTRTFNYKDGTKTITFSDLQDAINNKSGSNLDCCGAPCRSKLCIACSDVLLPEYRACIHLLRGMCLLDFFRQNGKIILDKQRGRC